MRTIHVADPQSRAFALQIAAVFARGRGIELKKGFKLDVRAVTGAANELVLVAGKPSYTSAGDNHTGAVSLVITRDGLTLRRRVKSYCWSGRKPPMKEWQTQLAERAAAVVLPYLKAKPKGVAKTIHVDGYYTQSEPLFRTRVVGGLRALGLKPKLTHGLCDAHPDPRCWGHLQLPFLNAYRWRDGKLALSPAYANAGGHEGKTTIRANVEPDLPVAKATVLLADKLVAWYGKLAAIAEH